MLTAALLAVAEWVDELERVCKLWHRQTSISVRLRWALLKKSKAAEIREMLQHARTDLGHVVQLAHLSAHANSSSITSGNNIIPSVKTVFYLLLTLNPMITLATRQENLGSCRTLLYLHMFILQLSISYISTNTSDPTERYILELEVRASRP